MSLRYFKVSSIPTLVQPDSVYFVKNGAKVDQYISSEQGNLFLVGSSNSGGASFTAENKDISLSMGMAVTQHPSGTGFIRADISVNARFCIGLLGEDINGGISGKIQISGTITIANWSAITGSSSLVAKSIYYLDTNGRITNTPSEVPGNICQEVGVAIDPQTLDINLGYPILL